MLVGYIEGPPIGPISTLLPNILKSYLSCNVADAQTFTKLAGAASDHEKEKWYSLPTCNGELNRGRQKGCDGDSAMAF